MILTDREISIALETGQLVIDPPPQVDALTSTAVDLTLDENALEWKPISGGFQIRPGPGAGGTFFGAHLVSTFRLPHREQRRRRPMSTA